MGQKTPLYNLHIDLGGKMADFAGWEMPLWYPTGQVAEHHATRQECGVFDICHMGEFKISGDGSLNFLSRMLTNHVEGMQDGQAMYHFMLNEAGGVNDDCILYRFNETSFMLVVNAGNIQTDFNWLQMHAPAGIELKNVSAETGKIDLQGPNAPKLLSRWISEETLSQLKFFRFLQHQSIDGMDVLVSRTGYTGEIGFELYVQSDQSLRLTKLLLENGAEPGAKLCGLGARDTLRVEAGLPLHGHELRPDQAAIFHPWEFAISWEHEFIGKDALLNIRESGSDFRVYPFKIDGRRKAMGGWEVFFEGDLAGEVLSGVISPTLENTPIGFLASKTPLDIESPVSFRQPGRSGELAGEIVKTPFVSLTSRKKMARFL